MRLRVDYYEFPKIDGRIIPKGQRYYLTIDVIGNEDQNELLKEVYSVISLETGVSRDCLKVMGWEEL